MMKDKSMKDSRYKLKDGKPFTTDNYTTECKPLKDITEMYNGDMRPIQVKVTPDKDIDKALLLLPLYDKEDDYENNMGFPYSLEVMKQEGDDAKSLMYLPAAPVFTLLNLITDGDVNLDTNAGKVLISQLERVGIRMKVIEESLSDNDITH